MSANSEKCQVRYFFKFAALEYKRINLVAHSTPWTP
jgi:hypothetical protein